MYNTAAPYWHRHLHLLGYTRAYTKLFQLLQQSGVLDPLKNGSTICDCGIGSAAFSLAFAQTVPIKAQISGVDVSPEMLEKAHQLLNQASVNHQLHQSDVRALPFSDSTFDLVMSAHMLEHLPNPVQGLQEMVRVLRPGAPLILAVTRPGPLGSLIQWYWGNHCLSSKVLAEIMTEAGLANVRIYQFTAGLSRWTSVACVGFKQKSAALRTLQP
jgi:demethylmenaquinone methyltransferase/2-methoxy-6-polyprenyl-1,4-benzoquinol methylase